MSKESTTIWNGQVKVGVLGAGQLGKMMAIEAANWHLPFEVMDKDSSFPAVPYASGFVQGDFSKEEDVLRFGRQVDVLTIEIEHVHIGALRQLEGEGIQVHPHSDALEVIIDKGKQKQFYTEHELPTSPFQLFSSP
jgi:5-(carboxyamino)imidazole ribonucleotide synthase